MKTEPHLPMVNFKANYRITEKYKSCLKRDVSIGSLDQLQINYFIQMIFF